MSRQTSYICDICGAEIIAHSAQAAAAESALLKLWPPGEYRAGPGQRIDLCLKCFGSLVNFLESDGVKND